MSGLEIAVAKTLGGLVTRKFGKNVVERWTRHRAEKFFEAFVESLSAELINGNKSSTSDKALADILEHDTKSEVLFDAYRSVCFSKSKTLGPKIIGFLTGYLVAEGRTANANEEDIFRAAESLSDTDLLELLAEFRKQANTVDVSDDLKRVHWEGGALVVPWGQDALDLGWKFSRSQEIDLTPLNFDEVFGAWGGNTARIGLLKSRVAQREVEYEENSEAGVDEPGVVRIHSWTLIFEAPCRQLCDLIERCLEAGTKSATKDVS